MTTLNPVSPGDLISADAWNRLVAEINALGGRVTQLEAGQPAGGKPVVFSTSPAPPIQVPSRLTLIGSNFVTPPSKLNTVTIAGVTIDDFVQGSGETVLILDLPAFANLPTTLPLTVSNRNGTSDPFPLALVAEPQQPPDGTTSMAKVTQNLGEIDVGHKYTFQFQLQAALTGPETFDISASWANAQGAAASAWSAAAQLVDATGAPLSPAKVTLSGGGNQSATVGVAVTVPQSATSVELALRAVSEHNPSRLNADSVLIPITIGQPYADNPNAPTFKPDLPTGSGIPIRVQAVNAVDVVQVSFGQTVHISVDAILRTAGNYTFTAAIDNPAGLWSLPAAPVDPPSFNAATPTTKTLAITVTSLATAVVADVKDLAITATRHNNDANDFSSTYRLPIGVFDMAHPS